MEDSAAATPADGVTDLVTHHYGATGLERRLLEALAADGVDIARLTVEDLAPVDELHAGGVPATQHVLSCLDLREGSRLLDVGCGLGGSSRVAASSYPCRVTGADLTPEFVRTAAALTARVGLSDQVTFETSSVDRLLFGDGSFDAAMMIHVGMNLPDKPAVFAEVRRVLTPGGRFAIFDQMLGSHGELNDPLPWAPDARSSFVETTDRYGELLREAGFEVEREEDRSASISWPQAVGSLSRPGLHVVFGPDWAERIGNQIAGAHSGALLPWLVVGRAV